MRGHCSCSQRSRGFRSRTDKGTRLLAGPPFQHESIQIDKTVSILHCPHPQPSLSPPFPLRRSISISVAEFSVFDDSSESSASSPSGQKNNKAEQACAMQSHRDHTRESTISDFWALYVERSGYELAPAEHLAVIIDQLKASKHIATDGQWRNLKPKKSLKTENTHFGRLKYVVNAIVTAAAACFPRYAVENRSSLFEYRPDGETLSEVPEATFHVHAIHYLAQSTYVSRALGGSAHCNTMLSRTHNGNINTADVVASWEVKRAYEPETIRDNESKTVEAAGHYLFADIRRRLHFSITVEKTTARLWCHSRSHSAVTKTFDIHKVRNEFIQWILFVSYGTEHQLGFDPTVLRVLDKHNRWQYQFDVRHRDGTLRTYQTRGILHENCVVALNVRAMRVFMVRLVTEKGNGDSFAKDAEDHALSDYWLRDGERVMLESEIQSAIFAALKTCTTSEEELLHILAHFMGILADGIVEREVGRGCGPKSSAAPETCIYTHGENPKVSKPLSSQVAGSDLHATASDFGPGSKLLQARGRKHYRTLYDSVCVDLYRVRDPAIFFFALERTVFVLSWFRRIGWMHGDISPGNVMLRCLSAGVDRPLCERYAVKIADLEYCKKYSRVSRQEIITGTGDYMAVEVQDRAHTFYNHSRVMKLARRYFAPNFFHDLESTIWMALEFVMIRVPRSTLEKADWRELGPSLNNLHSLANSVFPNLTRAMPQRRELLSDMGAREELGDLLCIMYGKESPVTGLPELLGQLGDAYIDVENRIDLVDAERDAEGKPLRMPKALFAEHAGLYDDICAAFQAVSRYYTDLEGQDAFIPFSRINFETGEIMEKRVAHVPQDSEVGAKDRHAVNEPTKRKLSEDVVDAPRALKRQRAMPKPPLISREPPRTRSRAKDYTAEGQLLRRSRRLASRRNQHAAAAKAAGASSGQHSRGRR
ncbi:hypothetical protein HDZ31DRAFT_28372 [Schizophyllum fasciatum]